jgi:hypothetical protein
MNTNGSDNSLPRDDAVDGPAFDKAEWIAQARRLLDESVDGIDAATLSRLNRGRQAALSVRARRSPRPWLLPAGLAGACAMLLAVAIVAPRHVGTTAGDAEHAVAAGGGATAAADAIGSDDSVEFYQDLDFYAWLDAQSKDDGG